MSGDLWETRRHTYVEEWIVRMRGDRDQERPHLSQYSSLHAITRHIHSISYIEPHIVPFRAVARLFPLI